ncbi:hypothetical protein A3C23_04800 [Candidatus Roizmanbacteria bacterium RIFCSPHIGHO2_02_FULL_37_13b]|uniref:Uncharacterized protein n=1 Tax=Candidatus Roizmanbacteria bacterium RIFCSPLOWO2_02_FULL_36_11 TaxID=1802071 RepID=A0A1F7JID1_9BACT|nr:MAG: hypothetical protein A3C23_04800 [Candidatus Roizmanbacteria bacterium RIFCSPHIGHO2_02_FULL_37_13b]OGK55373.1 MAG: hypothetical protein A3H78_03665 [Candidatus Roizmanbacteria bacterium RIFCSPLOWO2_02_FULL_36_11]
MNEAPLPTGAIFEATHFGPQGELLKDPVRETPQAEQPRNRGLFKFLNRQRTEVLPQEPEGPKHVLEAIEERGLIDRMDQASSRIHNIAEAEGGSNFVTPLTNIINLDEINRNRMSRTGADTPIAEVPSELSEIIRDLSIAATDQNPAMTYLRVEDRLISMYHSVRAGGIVIQLPHGAGIGPDNLLRVAFNPQVETPSPELQAKIQALRKKYSRKEPLLDLVDATVGYVERVVEALPAEVEAWNNGAETPTSNEGQKTLLSDLKQRHPENPLLRRDFGEVPEGYQSVYFVMPEARLEEIAEKGLLPTDEQYKSPDRSKTDRVVDEKAPEGFSRADAVFAYPDKGMPYDKSKRGRNWKPGAVVVEMKVDPAGTLVTDQGVYTEASRGLRDYGDDGGFAQDYWDRALTLDKYSRLKPSDKEGMFVYPEVVIPHGVEPEFIRVSGIIPEPPIDN